MNRSLLILLFLFGGISCDRRLSPQENQRLKESCGTLPTVRVSFANAKRHLYGGTPISGHTAPWAVQVETPGGFCSGTLISQRHVLLAAHCIMNSPDKAPPTAKESKRSCDGNDMILKQDNYYYQVLDSRHRIISNKVSKMVLFNYCNHKGGEYDDFMIMEVKEDILLSTFAFPACISNDLRLQKIGLMTRVTSYGHDNFDFKNTNRKGTYILRRGMYEILKPRGDWNGFVIQNKQRKTDVRPGDSGGSVVRYAKDRHYVIGVVTASGDETFLTAVTSVAGHYARLCYHTGRCI